MKLRALVNYLASLIKGEQAIYKDTSIVFTGRVIVTLLALIITPILTRLYSPQAYGEFALFNSIVQNMVILGTLALPSAINVAKKEHIQKILNLTLFSIIGISVLISLGLLLVSATAKNNFEYINFLKSYWYLIPVTFLLTSTTLIFKALHLRLKAFSLTTKIGVAEAFAAKGVNLYNGYLNLGGLGLIISDLIAKMISSVLLIYKLPKHYLSSIDLNLIDLRNSFKQFKQYPLFVMPAQWASILSTQLILWFIAFHYSANDLGKYSMALALINIPLYILSNSFQPVITQKLVSVRDGINEQFSFTSLLTILGIISIIVFGGFFLILPNWFVIFLGDKWEGIGLMIKILCAWNLILFIDQSINNGFLVFEKQQQKLYFNMVDLGLQIFVIAIALQFRIELNQFITFFVLAKVVASLIRIVYLSIVTRNSFST